MRDESKPDNGAKHEPCSDANCESESGHGSNSVFSPKAKKKYLTLTQATKLLPGRPHRSTIWRWCSVGVKTPTGRICLRHMILGCRLLTTQEWLEDFGERVARARRAARALDLG